MLNFIKAVLAGVMISIGAITYIECESILLGAFLFSIGLLGILLCNLNLYTGKVSYITSKKDIFDILVILFGNCLGCLLMLLFSSQTALNIVLGKLATSPLNLLLEAILCNILMYLAIEAYKKNQYLVTILMVTAFILAGFEHSIASLCFILSAKLFNFKVLYYMLVVILGNALGGILFHQLVMRVNIKNENS